MYHHFKFQSFLPIRLENIHIWVSLVNKCGHTSDVFPDLGVFSPPGVREGQLEKNRSLKANSPRSEVLKWIFFLLKIEFFLSPDFIVAFLRLSVIVFRPFWRCWKKQLTKSYINSFQRVDLHCIELATTQKITKNFPLEMILRGLLNPARSDGNSSFSQYYAKSRCFSSILATL